MKIRKLNSKILKKNILDNIPTARSVLTIALLVCANFCMAFTILQWKNEAILSFFTRMYSNCNIIIKGILILLLLIETVDLFLRLIKKERTALRDIAVCLAYFSAAGLLYKYSQFNRLVIFTFIIYFSRYVEFKTLLLTYIFVYTASLITLIFGNLTGNLAIYADGRGFAFGMVHSNSAGLFLLMYFWAAGYYLKNRKIAMMVLGIFVEIMLFACMKSRTAFICSTFFLFLFWLERPYNLLPAKIKKAINGCFIVLPVILMLVSSILGLLLYQDKITIDYNASVRFREIVQFALEEGISLYFRDIPLATYYGINDKIYYLDNGYARLLFHYGLVAFVIVNIGWLLTNISIAKHKDYYLLSLCICLYIYNTMEFLLALNDLPLLVMTFMAKENFTRDKLPKVNCDVQ